MPDGGGDAPAGGAGVVLRPAGAARRREGAGPPFPDARPVGRPEAGLDRRTAERLRRGARAPDARIDLHGMSAERAHGACMRFLGEAMGRGDRVVLVITGKGRRDAAGADRQSGRGGGVLRQSLPGWLRASPLGASIIGIYEAHRRHGGEGAFYVYLKRRR
jgi:DNA-nicking Smr family endonuclease